MFRLIPIVVSAVLLSVGQVDAQQHQTTDFSPILDGRALPYRLEVRPLDFGSAELPTLHSFAAGEYDGKWVLLAGRTNGLHGFGQSGAANFPEEFQNRDVWVVDPVARQSWHRSLEQDASSGLSAAQIAALTPANNQFTQIGDRLYMTGGYGATATGGLDTFDVLSAVDLPGIVDWVVNGTGQAADHVRQVSDPVLDITGGAMYEMGRRTHLVFGQDFQGGYIPGRNGVYSKQIRSFDIVDDGATLSIANVTTTPQVEAYRRRDLNVFPVIRNNALDEGLVVLSGVFTENFGVWSVPVEIDASGTPTMADPTLPDTFKQAMNNYHSAKLGLYSESREEMHEILLGGITLKYFDELSQQFLTDNGMPFTSQITSVVIDGAGRYSQHFLGAFPEARDLDGLLLRFGANAEFFPVAGLPVYDNGVIKFDELGDEMVVGHVFGGIVANAPHVRNNPNAASAASNQLFEVVLMRVPEPSCMVLAVVAFSVVCCHRPELFQLSCSGRAQALRSVARDCIPVGSRPSATSCMKLL